MTRPEDVIKSYAAAWHERDEGRRRMLLTQSWSDDGVYRDPLSEARGREALIRHIAGFQAHSAGSRIDIVGGVDHHHGRFHFAWIMTGPDRLVSLLGRDFGALDHDGRIRQIVGFFDPAPVS
jgi:hypothetical protein